MITPTMITPTMITTLIDPDLDPLSLALLCGPMVLFQLGLAERGESVLNLETAAVRCLIGSRRQSLRGRD